jgi:integrase
VGARLRLHSRQPSQGFPIPVSKSAKQKRDGFDSDDLTKMFSAPIFTGAASNDKWWLPGAVLIRDHRFWLLLLAAFTGARRGELCQLLVADVVERDGVLCLDIVDDDETGKSVKNADSKRLIPVHPELLLIGFAQYVEQRRKAGDDRLFDVPSGDQFGKWFARFTDKLEINSSRKVFHSFRHGFETAMRDSIDDFDARCRLTGREHGHSSSVYGKSHSPKKLFEEISKVNYPGLDLSHLANP